MHNRSMSTEKEVHSFSDNEVYFWIEQESSIHLKAASPHGDPVELTADEAREIGAALMAAADRLDRL
jgi:hypothetical protein